MTIMFFFFHSRTLHNRSERETELSEESKQKCEVFNFNKCVCVGGSGVCVCVEGIKVNMLGNC